MKELELARKWVHQAGEMIKASFNEEFQVKTKSSRTDLVTEIDSRVQDYIVGEIQAHFPSDKILGEENGLNKMESMKGRVWVLDPIDGTTNFYYQKKNFAVMLALYIDEIGQFGIIYDVMNQKMYWAIKGQGVYVNDEPLPKPKKRRVNEGLVAFNPYIYAHNVMNAQKIAMNSMGVRAYGSSGIEFIAMLNGEIS
ncbi:MAG: inositol monophosphatase family protein, partial [Streptococcaceae bacterium]|nr:inositol monophosphatase family protein [Streptococcaceae bacterium]